MKELGYDHLTDVVSDTEYRVYFYRIEKPAAEGSDEDELPLKPTAIVNFNTINPQLAGNVLNFWNQIWGNESPAIDMKTRLLLSLANGVGAGRMRQAAREFIKAYSVGATIAEFDELFAMFAWNQGVGYFGCIHIGTFDRNPAWAAAVRYRGLSGNLFECHYHPTALRTAYIVS